MNTSLFLLLFLFFALGTMVQGYQKIPSGIKFTTSSEQIEITFYSPRVVRVVKYLLGTFYTKESLSVIATPQKTDFKISDKDNNIVVSSKMLKVKINMPDGVISYFSSDDDELITEINITTSALYGTIQIDSLP